MPNRQQVIRWRLRRCQSDTIPAKKLAKAKSEAWVKYTVDSGKKPRLLAWTSCRRTENNIEAAWRDFPSKGGQLIFCL